MRRGSGLSSGKKTILSICGTVNICLICIIFFLMWKSVLFPSTCEDVIGKEELKALVHDTERALDKLGLRSGANVSIPSLGSASDADAHLRSNSYREISAPPLADCSDSNEAWAQKYASLEKQCVEAVQVHPAPDNAVPSSTSEALSTPSAKRWLVIGMPTVPRPHNEDYLLQTLASIAEQLPEDKNDLMYEQVLVVVVNVASSGEHARFDEARRLYAPGVHSKANYFRFVLAAASEVSYDLDPVKTRDRGSANVPGRNVRKQSRDIAVVIRKSVGLGRYFMFMEDDMKFCPYELTAIQYILQKASTYHPNWFAIRASYGMNGVFMHDDDIGVFADYLVKHQARRPPDHLVVEWYVGETPESKAYRGNRANVGFKYNLFDHLGRVSSLRPEMQTTFPRCYDDLLVPTVFEVEAYDPAQCPSDDMWPCSHIATKTRKHLNFKTISYLGEAKELQREFCEWIRDQNHIGAIQ